MAIDPRTNLAGTPVPANVATVRCTICHGVYLALDARVVEGCEQCARFALTGGPDHYSADHCRSGGIRAHAGCRGRVHCTCDGCF